MAVVIRCWKKQKGTGVVAQWCTRRLSATPDFVVEGEVGNGDLQTEKNPRRQQKRDTCRSSAPLRVDAQKMDGWRRIFFMELYTHGSERGGNANHHHL